MMNEEFLKQYTTALNKATEIAAKMREKGILVDGIDDQLVRDFKQANAEVDRLSQELIARSQ